MSEKKQEAVARIGERYPVLASEAAAAEVASVLKENMGEGVRSFDFSRIPWPTGIGTSFEVPSVDGSPQSTKKLTGLIVFHKNVRAAYLSKDVTNKPPDCSSFDGKTGFGIIGYDQQPARRDCATCPLYGFGTVCHPKDAMFILRENQSLPTMIMVPRTSLKNLRNYMMGLASVASPYWLVETAVELATDKNDAGQPFARAKFSLARKLTGDEKPAADGYHKAFAALMGGDAPVAIGDDAPPPTDDSELH